MSDTILHAIKSAIESNAVDFKDAIVDTLGAKVQSALQLKKVEYANSLFVGSKEEQEETTDD